jgi:hypothetical protein
VVEEGEPVALRDIKIAQDKLNHPSLGPILAELGGG